MPLIFVEEAKTHEALCPMSMGQGSVTRAVTCRGARCMAWRWVRTHINNPDGGDMIPSEDTHGFCGLAGPPKWEWI